MKYIKAMDERISNSLFTSGTIIIVFIASVVIATSFLFILGQSISYLNLLIALGIFILFIIWFTFKSAGSLKTGQTAQIGLFVIGSFALSFALSICFYDLSFDGQAYQQEAIIQLAQGWNPIHDAPVKIIHDMWINHYAKGPWYFAATIYKVTNRIEAGKAVNLLLILSSFFLILAIILSIDKKHPIRAIILSLIAALNPVAISQSFTYYIDGQLASLFLILISFAAMSFVRGGWLPKLGFFLSLILFLNLKFTAVVYSLFVVVGFLASIWIDNRKQSILKNGTVIAFAYVFGLFVIGFNPYITNTIDHGYTFYPLAGTHAVNIVKTNMPYYFQGFNRFEKLGISLFSKTENVQHGNRAVHKMPTRISRSELGAMVGPDCRIGGFGPLCGLIVILSFILVMAFLLLKKDHEKNTKKYVFMALIGLLMLSAFVNPELWWARYVPQIWLIPFLVIALGIYAAKNRVCGFIAYILIIAMTINVSLISAAYLYGQVSLNRRLKAEMDLMRKSKEPVLVKFGNFYSNRIRLKENNIQYKQGASLPRDASYLTSSDTCYYFSKDDN